MNTRWIVLTTASLILGVASASAQCGKMMGSGGHNHGNEATHDEHSTQSTTSESKAYVLINEDGKQEADIVIKDGYHPNMLVVKRGIPLRLNFDLQEESCTGTVVFKDFDIKHELKPDAVTAVEFTPDKSGSFAFACPMGMIEGTLVVKD